MGRRTSAFRRSCTGAGCALGIFGDLGQGAARDPEQGLPGARLRHAARHRRHARRARAARRTTRARCSSRPGTPKRWRPRCAGSRPIPSSRERLGGGGRAAYEAQASEQVARRALAQLARAVAGELTSAETDAAERAPALDRDRRLRRRVLARSRSCGTGPSRPGASTSGTWCRRSGRPRTATRSQITGPARRSDLAARRSLRPDPRRLRAALARSGRAPTCCSSAQAVAVALGALPVYWLARKHLGSERAALGFALAYLLYPPTQWLTLNEFHPVALACPLLLFAFWYLDEDRLAAVRGLRVSPRPRRRRRSPLVVAGLGVWYAFSHGAACGARAIVRGRAPRSP